jgi:hypothetical protein
MTSVTSLRAFKATRALTASQGSAGAKRLVEQLEDAPSNMLRFALAQRSMARAEPREAIQFLREHQYLESDRCEACGSPTKRGRRVAWKNKERRVYACNKQCAARVLRRKGIK